ncbi:MAG: PP0621 family protein [Pseudomonadota bacterium]
MGQLLRIAIVLLGLWLVLRFIKRVLAKRRSDSPAPPPPADMLRCDYCGMFVPRSDAITASGKIYCSGTHADANRARK